MSASCPCHCHLSRFRFSARHCNCHHHCCCHFRSPCCCFHVTRWRHCSSSRTHCYRFRTRANVSCAHLTRSPTPYTPSRSPFRCLSLLCAAKSRWRSVAMSYLQSHFGCRLCQAMLTLARSLSRRRCLEKSSRERSACFCVLLKQQRLMCCIL